MSLDGTSQPNYFQSIRRHAIAFASVFNNINLVRFAEDGVTPVTTQKVPLVYGPKEYWYQKLVEKATNTSDQGRNVEFATLLPRMSFYIPALTYDRGRQVNPTNQTINRRSTQGATKDTLEYYQTQPAPYNLNAKLTIYSSTMDDGLNILEQILPMFTPQLNVRIRMIDQTDEYKSVPIILNQVTQDDNYQDTFTTGRIIQWELDFTIQAMVYPPLGAAKIILQTIVDFKNNYLDPPPDLEIITVTALAQDPPDYNKDNSSVEITDS